MTINLSGKLPKYDDRNGLEPLVRHFLNEPGKTRLAIVVLETTKITDDLENYDRIPTVSIRAIEPVSGDDLGRLRAMLQRAHSERTGNLELPAEWETVLADMAPPSILRDGSGFLPGSDR